MNKSTLASVATILTEQSIDKMLATIRIPPRPSLLTDVQQELLCDDPSPQKLARIIGQDVAMAGALLKLANSSFIGMKLKAKSVEQAVIRLGVEQCSLLLTGILARETVQIEGVTLVEFWDFSTKRAQTMAYLAKKLDICRSDVAHTTGLFCNIGIPLLMAKFANYEASLTQAGSDPSVVITVREDRQLQTNHASLGALLARTWGLPGDVVEAILLHHHYAAINEAATPATVRSLIALSLLADYGTHRYQSQQPMAEWILGGAEVIRYLSISEHDVDDIFDEIHALFDGAAQR